MALQFRPETRTKDATDARRRRLWVSRISDESVGTRVPSQVSRVNACFPKFSLPASKVIRSAKFRMFGTR